MANTVQLLGATHYSPVWGTSGGEPLLLWRLPKVIWATDSPDGDLLMPFLTEVRAYTERNEVLELELLARNKSPTTFEHLDMKSVMFKLITGKERRSFPCDIPLLSNKVYVRSTAGLASGGSNVGLTVLGRLEWRVMKYADWQAWFQHYQLDLEEWWDRKYLQEGFYIDSTFQRDGDGITVARGWNMAPGGFGTLSTGTFVPTGTVLP